MQTSDNINSFFCTTPERANLNESTSFGYILTTPTISSLPESTTPRYLDSAPTMENTWENMPQVQGLNDIVLSTPRTVSNDPTVQIKRTNEIEVQQLRHEVKEFRFDIDNKNMELQSCHTLIMEKEKEIERLEQQIQNGNTENEKLHKQIKELEITLAKSNKMVEEMHEHNQKVQQELTEKIQRALDDKKNGDDLLSVKEKEKLDLQRQVEELKLELLQNSETAAHRTKQLAKEMDNENKKKQEDLMDKLSKALDKKKNADELLAAKEKENAVLRTQLDELKVKNLDELVALKEKENITLQSEINNILEEKKKENVVIQKAIDEKNQLEMKMEEVLKTNAKIVSQKMRTELLYTKQLNEMETKLKEKDDQIQSQQQWHS